MPEKNNSGQPQGESTGQLEPPKKKGYRYLPMVGAFGLGAFALAAWLLGWFGGSGDPLPEDNAPPPGQEAEKPSDTGEKPETKLPEEKEELAQRLVKLGFPEDKTRAFFADNEIPITQDPPGPPVHPDPSKEAKGSFPGGDIEKVAVFAIDTTDALPAQSPFSSNFFEPGPHEGYSVLSAGKPIPPSGYTVVIAAWTAAPAPTDPLGDDVSYGLFFDDGDPSNNYSAPKGRELDPLQGTNFWTFAVKGSQETEYDLQAFLPPWEQPAASGATWVRWPDGSPAWLMFHPGGEIGLSRDDLDALKFQVAFEYGFPIDENSFFMDVIMNNPREGPIEVDPVPIFADGFESGDVSPFESLP